VGAKLTGHRHGWVEHAHTGGELAHVHPPACGWTEPHSAHPVPDKGDAPDPPYIYCLGVPFPGDMRGPGWHYADAGFTEVPGSEHECMGGLTMLRDMPPGEGCER
jgi:hypothetical protein